MLMFYITLELRSRDSFEKKEQKCYFITAPATSSSTIHAVFLKLLSSIHYILHHYHECASLEHL